MQATGLGHYFRLADQVFAYFEWCKVVAHAARYSPSHQPHVKPVFEQTSLKHEVGSIYFAGMDKDWFKRHLRMRGKTADDLAKAIARDRAVVSRIMNGHQQITLEQARIFADELNVDVADVLVHAGLTDAPVAQALSPGFAESDAAPWVPGPAMAEGVQVPSIAQALGGGKPGVDVWRVKGLAMSQHGFLPGDYMLVDTHQAERVKPGDAVIAQVYNRTGATTVLRTYAPPVLISADPNDTQVHVVDGTNVVIRGKVTASWRV